MSDHHSRFVFEDGSVGLMDSYGGPESYRIDTPRGLVEFEMSDRFGPLPLAKDGSVRDLHHAHPFWRIVSLWATQGSRLDENGKCVWHEPKKPVYRHLGGKHYEIIEDGEVGWDW